jgi:hypothetical protein
MPVINSLELKVRLRQASARGRSMRTLARMDWDTKCGCNRSLAVIAGAFAGMAVALFLAEDRCLDLGGRVSDSAWSCQAAGGAAVSLWSLVTPGIAALMAITGVLVYLAANALGRRWLLKLPSP